MRQACTKTLLMVMLTTAASRGDGVIYRYEGDALPYVLFAGWIIADPCDPPCSESVENGQFVLRWPQASNLANYHYWISQPPSAPPPSLWVEWRFRSNHPLGPNFFTCDANFKISYAQVHQIVSMYGDAAICFSGGCGVPGLAAC